LARGAGRAGTAATGWGGIEYGTSGPGCGTGAGRGLFRCLAAGRFGPRALPAAGLFLLARRVLGLVFMPSMIACSIAKIGPVCRRRGKVGKDNE